MLLDAGAAIDAPPPAASISARTQQAAFRQSCQTSLEAGEKLILISAQ